MKFKNLKEIVSYEMSCTQDYEGKIGIADFEEKIIELIKEYIPVYESEYHPDHQEYGHLITFLSNLGLYKI